MRPHRLRVQAFGAFAATEEVSFDDLEGLFLLHGETGAGKTTLLDAIAFALYGRVPGERGKTRRLRSDHAPAGVRTEVELEATIGGRRLRITRKPEQERPKKSGTGVTKEQASVLLAEVTPAGDWEVKSARIGEADTEIADLMGMSAEQFFQVVLLPQGQFAQFLHADAEARARLLQKLFGTDRFRAVEDWLAERRRATAAEVTVAADRVNLLVAQVAQAASVAVPETMDVPAGAPESWQTVWAVDLAASAAAERDAAATVVAARKADLDMALAAKTLAGQLADRQRRRRDTLLRQAELQAAAGEIDLLRAAADAAARAAEVALVLAEADRAAAAAAAARRAEEQARAAIPDDSTTAWDAGPGALRAAGQEQQSRLGMLDGLRADASQAAAEEENAAAALAKAAELDLALTAARSEVAGHQAARPAAAQARDDAGRAGAALPPARAAADTARRVAADSAALAAERADRDRLHEAHLGARERAVTRREEASAVREARIDGMRAELAAAMTDGSPCPVCGSLDHPDPVEPTFQPVSREQEDAATVAAEAASGEADELGRHVAAADARIGDLAQRLAGAGFPGSLAADDGALALLPAGPFSAETALVADLAALAAAVRQAAADAGRLETDAAALAARAETHPGRQRELEALDAAIAAGNARLAELTEKHAAAQAEAAGAADRAGEHRAKISAQLGVAPDLDAAARSTRLLAESLTSAADATDLTARTAAEAQEAAERAVQATAEAGFDAPDAARAGFRDAAWRRDAADRSARPGAAGARRRQQRARHRKPHRRAARRAGATARGRARRPCAAPRARRGGAPAGRPRRRPRRQPVPHDPVQLRPRRTPRGGRQGGERAPADHDRGPFHPRAHRHPPRRRQGGARAAGLRRVDRRRPRHKHAVRRRDVPRQPRARARPRRRGDRRGGGHPDGGAVRGRGLRHPGRGHPRRGDERPRRPARRRPDRGHRQPRRRTPPAHPRPGARPQGPPRQPRHGHRGLAAG